MEHVTDNKQITIQYKSYTAVFYKELKILTETVLFKNFEDLYTNNFGDTLSPRVLTFCDCIHLLVSEKLFEIVLVVQAHTA